MSTTTAKASVELLSPPAKIWPLLGDTEQVNRWMGQAPFKMKPIEASNKSGARFHVESQESFFSMDHEALPFEWENERYLKAVRKMIGSPFKTITLLVKLEPGKSKDGTRVDVSLEVETRSALAKPIAMIATNRYVQRYVELAKQVDAYAREQSETPYRMATAPRPDVAQIAKNRLLKAGVESALADKLTKHVADAPDIDVIHMRPFEIADDWQLDRSTVLKGFLQSVIAGLTELRWSIICPSCRTASSHVDTLEQISAEGHCQLCDISFDLDLDRSVEATFLPHAAVRTVVSQQFCIGGPTRTPHVISQANLDASGSHAFTTPNEPGRFRIFARGGAMASVESVEGGAEEASVVVEEKSIKPAEVSVRPGGKINVRNATTEGRHVKLERLGYASAAATAHVVSTMPEFRRFFSGELLKRETPLKVSHVAILFSDLVGSTALYSHVGDASAFRLVDDHFDVLREVIARHEGTVVKTMGDAVLAAFTDASKATAAAVEALEKFETFRLKREHGDRIGIKLGLFAGPCYVVNANGALDYFGQTVNVASRVQHLAGAAQIVLPNEIFETLDDELRAKLSVVETFEATVKGVDHPIPLVRVARK
jgi:adenylate cyclase